MAEKMLRIAAKGEDGLSKAVKADKNGNIGITIAGDGALKRLSELARVDMNGKQQGIIYNNPHNAYYKGSATFDLPSLFGGTQFSTAEYERVYTKDGQLAINTTMASGAYAQQYFKLNVLESLKNQGKIPSSWTADDLRKNLKYLKINWTGYGTSPTGSGAIFKVFIPKTNAWSGGAPTAYVPNSTDLFYLQPENTLPEDVRIDNSGVIHILLHSRLPSDGVTAATINTDFLNVEVRVGQSSLSVEDSAAHAKLEEIAKLIGQGSSNSMQGVNSANGSAVSNFSFVIDDAGYPVLRIIDASPYGYDPVKDAINTNQRSLETVSEKDILTVLPANGSLELMFSTPITDFKKLIVTYRLANETLNGSVKVLLENRMVSNGFVVYGEEKVAVAGKYGHKTEFDLAYPRATVMLTNSSATAIDVSRFAIVGVR